jgi:hypothetical protein
MTAQSAEPPWNGPVCPVVWEGRHREVSPYPDQLPRPQSSVPEHALDEANGADAPCGEGRVSPQLDGGSGKREVTSARVRPTPAAMDCNRSLSMWSSSSPRTWPAPASACTRSSPSSTIRCGRPSRKPLAGAPDGPRRAIRQVRRERAERTRARKHRPRAFRKTSVCRTRPSALLRIVRILWTRADSAML